MRRRFNPLRSPNVQGVLVLGIVTAISGVFLLNNRQPEKRYAQPALIVTNTPNWQPTLEFQINNPPSPTVDTSPTVFVPPTLPPAGAGEAISAAELAATPLPSSTPLLALPLNPSPTPIFANATPIPLPTGVEIGRAPDLSNAGQQFQLPPEQVPLSVHPFDHFYLTRPVDVSANSEYLFYYPYGSGGQGWRIHRGLDMPNRVGQEVQAAGSGLVVYAGRSLTNEYDGDLEVYSSYGNVVVIEHDFGRDGQPLWTLYAHLSQILVSAGDRVEMNDVIGLVGVTGNVTGPHVHFEVRQGINSYSSTRNPILWMAPYIGHGVVAGRVVDEEGRFIDNLLVELNYIGGGTADRTTTYVNPYEPGKRIWTVVPDDNYRENFVMGDIPAGEYEVVVLVEDELFRERITVRAGTVSFVEMQLSGVTAPSGGFDEEGLAEEGAPPSILLTPTLPPTAIPTPTPAP